MTNTTSFSFSLPTPVYLGLLVFAALFALAVAVHVFRSRKPGTDNRKDGLRARLGVPGFHFVPFFVCAALWVGITTVLTAGLFGVIFDVLADVVPDSDTDRDVWNFRFKLIQITALTTVLGAAIALPFTLVRLGLSQKQTDTATESLFNEKINAATEGLYARRQVTVWKRHKGHVHQWQDDIVQRNAAIDRLEGLARENTAETPRIARLLSVYVRELSAEVPAQEPPKDASPDQLQKWAGSLPKPRSDMEKAAQTLGRLHEHAKAPLESGEIDLRGANLQNCDLAGLAFDKALFQNAQLQGADLQFAQLQGANLERAQLQRADLGGAQLQGAVLMGAQLQGANLMGARLQGAVLRGAQLQGADLGGAQLQGANLWHAQLQRANLGGAQLQGADLGDAQLQGADLWDARFDAETFLTAATLRGAAVRNVDFTTVPQIAQHLEDIFGDASVTLPEGVEAPGHWPQSQLGFPEFDTQWRAWQATLPPGWDQPKP